eukprot:6455968-Pyramimonas_sp.AAC.1
MEKEKEDAAEGAEAAEAAEVWGPEAAEATEGAEEAKAVSRVPGADTGRQEFASESADGSRNSPRSEILEQQGLASHS